MREDDINLAGGTLKEKKASILVRAPSFISFAVVFIISATILGYSLFLKLNSSSLDAKARELRGQISALSLKKEKILITSERVAAARTILNSRANLDTTIRSILSIVPDPFSVESVSGDTSEIDISVSSDNLADFANLLSEKIPAAAHDKNLGIKSVKVDTFSQTPNGYISSLVFALNNKKK